MEISRDRGLPCKDCPFVPGNAQNRFEERSKIQLHRDGVITFLAESLSGTVQNCQETVFKEAAGPEADALRDRMARCTGVEESIENAPTALGRLGIHKYMERHCPAIGDLIPNDSGQLTRMFERK